MRKRRTTVPEQHSANFFAWSRLRNEKGFRSALVQYRKAAEGPIWERSRPVCTENLNLDVVMVMVMVMVKPAEDRV